MKATKICPSTKKHCTNCDEFICALPVIEIINWTNHETGKNMLTTEVWDFSKELPELKNSETKEIIIPKNKKRSILSSIVLILVLNKIFPSIAVRIFEKQFERKLYIYRIENEHGKSYNITQQKFVRSNRVLYGYGYSNPLEKTYRDALKKCLHKEILSVLHRHYYNV